MGIFTGPDFPPRDKTTPGLAEAKVRDGDFMARIGMALAGVQIQDSIVIGAQEVTSLFAGTELPRALVRGMGPIITVGLRHLGHSESDVVFIKQNLENGITALRNERQLAEEARRIKFLAEKARESAKSGYSSYGGYWN